MRSSFLTVGFLIIYSSIFAQENTPRNIITVETNIIMSTHFSYDRVVCSVSEKSSLMLGADYIMGTGFGYGAHWIAPEINLSSFGPKHFLETGIQYAIYLNRNETDGDSESSPGIRLAYRYQSLKGFIFRFCMNAYFAVDPPVFPTIGFGYAFK